MYALPDGKLTPCIEWRRGKSGGYGIWRNAEGAAYRYERVHRIVYRRVKGEIPDGHQIHHLCRNRACINPDHLEAVPAREHMHCHRKDFCKRGHRLTDDNVYVRPSGKRNCRTCKQMRERQSWPGAA